MILDKAVLDSYEINQDCALGKIFGNGQANSQGVNADNINRYLNFKPFDDKKYNEINCEKEEDFVSRFEKEIFVEREAQALEKKELAEKKIHMQQEIQALRDTQTKEDNDKLDSDYAQLISQEEQ